MIQPACCSRCARHSAAPSEARQVLPTVSGPVQPKSISWPLASTCTASRSRAKHGAASSNSAACM